jgi:hypothetical protein
MDGSLDGLGLFDHAKAIAVRADGSYADDGVLVDMAPMVLPSGFGIGGFFGPVECFSPDGKLRWVDDAKNAIVNGCLDDILNVYFRNGTPAATLYMGIVDNASFTQFQATDTAASHSGWSENTAYSASTRATWSPGASSGQTITNASSVNFSITSTGNIRGLFVITDNTKGGTSGTLISTAAFTGGVQAVNNGDTLKVTYTISDSST